MKFVSLNSWEGYVTSRSHDHFIGVVQDLTDSNAPTEEITVDMYRVPANEQYLVVPGGIFVWEVGYYIHDDESQTEASRFIFRKDVWTKEDLEEAKQKAHELSKLFNSDN